MAKKTQIKNKKLKSNQKADTTSLANGNEIINLIKIVLILCAVLLIFYFITELVTNKNENDTYKENTTATIQYDKILVGQILNQKEKDYYVLIEKENDQYIELYNYYLSNYDGENKDFKYYRVDLSDIFNGNHVGENNELKGNVSDFKFAGTTLLRIKNGTITETYQERESIISYLENLI